MFQQLGYFPVALPEPSDDLMFQQLGYFPVALPALLITVASFQLSSRLNLYLTWILGVIFTDFLFDVVVLCVSWLLGWWDVVSTRMLC